MSNPQKIACPGGTGGVVAPAQSVSAELAALWQKVAEQAAEIERLREVLRLAKTMAGHNHWDRTQQHGAGCPKCIEQTAVCRAIDVDLSKSGDGVSSLRW